MTTRRRQDFPELTLPSYVSRVNSFFLCFKMANIPIAHVSADSSGVLTKGINRALQYKKKKAKASSGDS
ncbi:hypothetical protein Tco_1040803 [Tanacetum coccineum]|uniref:Uncharacterized protein n=1 Tax=Tanacetum coccineum TaxID=301880 RepID=A0ABQ5GGX0_9ASTR